MKQSPSPIINLVLKYNGLMQRYVQRIIKDHMAVTLVVTNAFETFYGESQLQPQANTRQLLKACALHACLQWFKISVRVENNNGFESVALPQQSNAQLHLIQQVLAGKAENRGFTGN